jgi:hypothetical protein
MNDLVTTCDRILASFAAKKDIATAKRCIKELARAVGPGFHPDTRFDEYVDSSGAAIFAADVAARLDDGFELLLATLDSAGIDPCEVALPVQRRLLSRM